MKFIKLIAVVIFFIVCTQSWFVPDRLVVVDKNKNNFLVRGNLPIENN